MGEMPAFDSVGESNPETESVAERTRSTNFEGGESFDPDSAEFELFKNVVNNLLESTYYESVEDQFRDMWEAFSDVADENPEFVLQLATYARQEEGLRDVPQVLLVLAANDERTKEYVADYAPQIIDRTDEFNTVISYQLRAFGKPIPRPLRNGIEDALHKAYAVVEVEFGGGSDTESVTYIDTAGFVDDVPSHKIARAMERVAERNGLHEAVFDDWTIVDSGYVHDEYTFSKYAQRNKSVSLHDVINLVRPNPRSDNRDDLFGRIVKGELDDHPDVEPLREDRTWESELSEDDDRTDAEKFRERLDDMGLFARIRNLRNMREAGLSGEEIFDYDDGVFGENSRSVVRNSKMFPFRFYQAYKACTETGRSGILHGRNYFQISGDGVLDGFSRDWLECAIDESVHNLPDTIENTHVAVDMSGSMASPISSDSDLDCMEIGALFGAVLMKRNCDVSVFATDFKHVVGTNEEIENMSVFELAREIVDAGSNIGGGTNGVQVLEDLEANGADYDRVVFLTDLQMYGEQAYRSRGSLRDAWRSYANSTRTDPTLVTVDLQNYGDLKMPEGTNDVLQLQGWSSSMLEMLDRYERGDEIVDEVREITVGEY